MDNSEKSPLELAPADAPEADGVDAPAVDPAPAPKPKSRAKRKARPPAPQVTIRPVASPASTKTRHWGLILSFAICVLLPIAATTWYLYERAADQYASTLGFTVRSEESTSASDLLGGIGSSLTGGSANRDADILYEFILSQEIVRKIDARLDLRTLYSRHYETDPLLSYDPDGTIEDLTAFWRRMVRASYDSGTGLMELQVLAFRPEDARAIAEAVFAESSATINALSAIARQDATRYAQEDLDIAVERLKGARETLTALRLANQIVDPEADIQAQMGLLSNLQEQQAEALIAFDLLRETARDGDPRLEQARRRLDVIEARIADERRKFGAGDGDSDGEGGVEYATTIAEFERLTVDREFAEMAYSAALSAFDAARAEANRQSRYLAAYITPTLAEKSQYPQRPLLIFIVGGFGFLLWAISALVYYALRDRR